MIPILATVALAAAVGTGALAVALGYRCGSPRGWNRVAVFAVGGAICAYGVLGGVLCGVRSVPSESTTRAWGVAVAGGLLAGAALVDLYRLDRR